MEYTNVEKIKIGREAIEKYRQVCAIKGVKAPADRLILDKELEVLGLKVSEFYPFNFQQNFLEADRCFRPRKIDNPNEVGLCDGCVGRSVVPCYDNKIGKKLHCSYEVAVDYFKTFSAFTPDSIIVKEQVDEAVRLGVTPPHIQEPITVFWTHTTDHTCPDYCVGRLHQVEELQFDIIWGMGELVKFGAKIYDAMVQLNVEAGGS